MNRRILSSILCTFLIVAITLPAFCKSDKVRGTAEVVGPDGKIQQVKVYYDPVVRTPQPLPIQPELYPPGSCVCSPVCAAGYECRNVSQMTLDEKTQTIVLRTTCKCVDMTKPIY